MEQYHLYAYEVLGDWHITMARRSVNEGEPNWIETIYRGDHVAIDEEDPLVRAVLILEQVAYDLNMAIRGELDTLEQRPMSH